MVSYMIEKELDANEIQKYQKERRGELYHAL